MWGARFATLDFLKPFILTTDASGIAVGGILSQDENKDQPIAYTSRNTLPKTN